VRTVGSEGELRDCIDSMQELWMLGASAGVLHCAAISDEASLPNASSNKADAGGASAVDGGLSSIDAAQGAEPRKDERRLTCLHLAADSGDSDRMYGCITGKVCRKGDVRVDVNAKDTDGATPLHYAVSGGHTKCAEILLSNRAHLHAADDYGCTALHTATAETMKLLILNGARLNVPDSEGWTPLHKACAINSVPEASLLIESMADVDIPSRIGFTPLHVAARYGSVEAQDLLIAANAEVLARTSDGQVAQELAEAGRCSPKLLTAHKEANSALNAIKRRELGRQEGKSVEGLVTRIMSMFTDKNGEFYRQGRTIYDIFQQFDTDKDGTLTLTEFHEALSGPPFYIKYSDRDSLRSYIDVDGDDVIEIDEFATALLGLPPPTSDKDIIRTAIDSLDLRLPILLDSTIRSVCLSIDFLSQHRSGAYSKEYMVQVGSRQLPVREGRIPVKHQQRLCVAEGGEAQWSSNRRGIFEGLDDGTDDALSVEIILYGEFELPDGEVSVRELGSGKASMVPEDISSNDVREEKKVAIYTQIASAAELPSKWSEASLPRLRALLSRVPKSVQKSLVCRDGVPPTRGQVIDCLSSWEKTSGAPRASPAKGANASGVKKADMDPIAEAHIHVRSPK
jgi:ankyrin repeat protein